MKLPSQLAHVIIAPLALLRLRGRAIAWLFAYLLLAAAVLAAIARFLVAHQHDALDLVARYLFPDGWRFAPESRALVAAAGGRDPIRLTAAEYELIRLLAAAGGEPVDRETISRAVFRRPWRVEDRAVDGLVKRIRRKLDRDAIASVRGVGYALLTIGATMHAGAGRVVAA